MAQLTLKATVPSPLALRDRLEEMAVRELQGPAQGDEEEVSERIRDRYLVGILAPRQRAEEMPLPLFDKPAGPAAEDDDNVEGDFPPGEELGIEGVGRGNLSDDDGPTELSVPMAKTVYPASLGLHTRILLVSYAVYSIPNIREAVVRTARRGVRITVVVETPDKLDVQNEYSTLQALGDDVARCSTVYYWPKENRKADGSGKLGILHVKCVVGDGSQLFLSSANLTKYAFSLNMELGVLITGGRAPVQTETVFQNLINDGILAKL